MDIAWIEFIIGLISGGSIGSLITYKVTTNKVSVNQKGSQVQGDQVGISDSFNKNDKK